MEERNKTPLPIGKLWDRRTEILYNLEQLRPVKTSLTDVVTYEDGKDRMVSLYGEDGAWVRSHLLELLVNEFRDTAGHPRRNDIESVQRASTRSVR